MVQGLQGWDQVHGPVKAPAPEKPQLPPPPQPSAKPPTAPLMPPVRSKAGNSQDNEVCSPFLLRRNYVLNSEVC